MAPPIEFKVVLRSDLGVFDKPELIKDYGGGDEEGTNDRESLKLLTATFDFSPPLDFCISGTDWFVGLLSFKLFLPGLHIRTIEWVQRGTLDESGQFVPVDPGPLKSILEFSTRLVQLSQSFIN
ncbi:MAG: hypothetical protein GY816_21490 [Cytophagales bacterium]|nr:hypothetical protein [Cytophagales bacterium]